MNPSFTQIKSSRSANANNNVLKIHTESENLPHWPGRA